MQIIIDGDVVLYMAVHSAEEDTLESSVERFVGILKDVEELHFASPENMEIFLSDKTNFRQREYPSYKANRKNIVPPTHLAGLRSWVFANMERVQDSPNGEADDYMLIRASELDEARVPYVIATVDKDLKTHPGRFYNLRRRDWEDVSEDAAHLFMIQQFVMGDAGDGIAGLRGYGPKKTQKIINSYHNLEQNHGKSKEIWKEQYGKGWETPYNLTCNTAFIRRRAKDLQPLDFSRMRFSDFRAMLRIPLQDNADS